MEDLLDVALGLFLLGLGGLIISVCVRRVPDGHVGIVTLFRKRTGEIKPAGWHLFWPSFIEDAYMVNLDRDGWTLSEHTLLLPDGSQVALNVSLPWSPDPENISALVDAGDGDEVNKALAEIIEERLARWGCSEKEGPQTWRQAIQSYQEVKQVISEAIGLEGNKIKQFGIVVHRVSVTEIKPLGELEVLLERERQRQAEERRRKVEQARQQAHARTPEEIVRERLRPRIRAGAEIERVCQELCEEFPDLSGLIIKICGQLQDDVRQGKKIPWLE